MPARPRHCIGQQHVHPRMPLALEPGRRVRSPGARRRPSSAPRLQSLGGGLVASGVRWSDVFRCGHPSGTPLEVPVLRSMPRVARVLAVLVLAACAAGDRAAVGDSARPAATRAGAEASAGPIVDDFGDTLRLPAGAPRVVSLNPTTTELAFALGAGDLLVGRS